MKLKLNRTKGEEKYTSSHSMREKILKLAACTMITLGVVSSMIGTYLTSLISINDMYVFTNSSGQYKMCEVLGTGDVQDCISGKTFLDKDGFPCRYGRGIYWKGTNKNLSLSEQAILRKLGINYASADFTYLPDMAGIPIESILPKECLEKVGSLVTHKEARMIEANLGKYMLEYLNKNQFPTTTCLDHYEQYGIEEELEKQPSLYIYQGVDENGKKTGEVRVGYAIWDKHKELSKSYFYDITNNQLMATEDENGTPIYTWVELVRGKKTPGYVTLDELEEGRLRNWELRDSKYEDDEFKPLFADSQKQVSFDSMENIAYESESMYAMGKVMHCIEQDAAYRKPKEQGE